MTLRNGQGTGELAGRDAAGRFTRGNRYATAGGEARARALPPERRREIAARGFEALTVLYFNSDRAAAKAWLSRRGVWAGLFSSEDAAREFPLPGQS